NTRGIILADIAAGMTLGQWELKKRIGRGGNGQVWESIGPDQQIVAIKILQKFKKIAYQRFNDEVIVMRSCGVDGVIPIIDSFVPEWPTNDYAWYAMPLGQPFTEFIVEKSIPEVIS